MIISGEVCVEGGFDSCWEGVVGWGNLSGCIIVKGEVLFLFCLEIIKDIVFCGCYELFDELLIIGFGGGFKNVFVFL